uniref:Transcriptional regulator, LysR family n=1 Tax=Loigolactobacillus rennini TaxID=238013 RepID=A0A1K2I3W9_9LACO|nr:Transcriptional regulator, LysR family [Loigolactobacillus rennini]
MEIRLLRYFWTIADLGTISAAANQLHITQPTLSRQLQGLEAQLGTPLFVRHPKHLELTQAGAFLKSRAAEILTLTHQTEQEFAAQKQHLFSGHIRIGCVAADNSDTMAMLLEELVHDYPAVTYNIITGASDLIEEQLDRGLLDVAVLLEPVAAQKYHTLTLPRTEQWGLLVAKQSQLAHKSTIQPTDLADLPLMLSQRPAVQNMLKKWRGEAIKPPRIIGTFNLIFNVLPLIEANLGAALSIQGITSEINPETLNFIPLVPNIKTRCILVWRKNRVLTPVVTEYIRRFKTAFGTKKAQD